jgi:hypothetical protein
MRDSAWVSSPHPKKVLSRSRGLLKFIEAGFALDSFSASDRVNDEENHGDNAENPSCLHGEARYPSCTKNGGDESDNEADNCVV